MPADRRRPIVQAAPAPDSVFLEELTWTELRDRDHGRADDDHRADRRHRAERPAHGARQAQRAGPGAGGADRAAARQRAGRAGHRLCARRARRPAGRAHALCRHDHHARTPPSRRCSNPRRAASSQHGFRDIVFLGDHGGYQKRPERRSPTRLNREWAATPVRVHAIAEYYRVDRRPTTSQALKRRGFRDDEIGSMPASPTRRWRWPSTRAWCAPTGCTRDAAAAARRRAWRPAARERRARPARRRPDRRRDRRRRSGSDRARAESSQPAPIACSPFRSPRSPSCRRAALLVRRCAASACAARAVAAARADSGAAGRRRRSTTVPGMPPVARPGQSLQRDRRRQAEPGGRRTSCRASTCRTCSRTTST